MYEGISKVYESGSKVYISVSKVYKVSLSEEWIHLQLVVEVVTSQDEHVSKV